MAAAGTLVIPTTPGTPPGGGTTTPATPAAPVSNDTRIDDALLALAAIDVARFATETDLNVKFREAHTLLSGSAVANPFSPELVAAAVYSAIVSERVQAERKNGRFNGMVHDMQVSTATTSVAKPALQAMSADDKLGADGSDRFKQAVENGLQDPPSRAKQALDKRTGWLKKTTRPHLGMLIGLPIVMLILAIWPEYIWYGLLKYDLGRALVVVFTVIIIWLIVNMFRPSKTIFAPCATYAITYVMALMLAFVVVVLLKPSPVANKSYTHSSSGVSEEMFNKWGGSYDTVTSCTSPTRPSTCAASLPTNGQGQVLEVNRTGSDFAVYCAARADAEKSGVSHDTRCDKH